MIGAGMDDSRRLGLELSSALRADIPTDVLDFLNATRNGECLNFELAIGCAFERVLEMYSHITVQA